MQSLARLFPAFSDTYTMSNPNALWEDIEKLNTLYEELCWDPDDELVFTHDGTEIIIYNKSKEKQ